MSLSYVKLYSAQKDTLHRHDLFLGQHMKYPLGNLFSKGTQVSKQCENTKSGCHSKLKFVMLCISII